MHLATEPWLFRLPYWMYQILLLNQFQVKYGLLTVYYRVLTANHREPVKSVIVSWDRNSISTDRVKYLSCSHVLGWLLLHLILEYPFQWDSSWNTLGYWAVELGCQNLFQLPGQNPRNKKGQIWGFSTCMYVLLHASRSRNTLEVVPDSRTIKPCNLKIGRDNMPEWNKAPPDRLQPRIRRPWCIRPLKERDTRTLLESARRENFAHLEEAMQLVYALYAHFV